MRGLVPANEGVELDRFGNRLERAKADPGRHDALVQSSHSSFEGTKVKVIGGAYQSREFVDNVVESAIRYRAFQFQDPGKEVKKLGRRSCAGGQGWCLRVRAAVAARPGD